MPTVRSLASSEFNCVMTVPASVAPAPAACCVAASTATTAPASVMEYTPPVAPLTTSGGSAPAKSEATGTPDDRRIGPKVTRSYRVTRL